MPDSQRSAPSVNLTPRNILIALAVVLLIVLAVLIVYLLFLNRNTLSTQVDGDPVAGLEAELVIEGPGTGDTPRFKQPMGAAWSPDGREIYVADTGNNRICVFSRGGRFLREFGGFGIAKPLAGAERTWDPGELNYPTDVAVDDEGNVYVADFYNDSISAFTPEGEYIRRFPDPTRVVGRGGSGQDGTGIAVTALDVGGDYVYATDSYQVVVFTLNGTFVRQFGKPGLALGELDRPNGVVVDENMRVIVSDSNNNRVVAYSPLDQPLWVAGGRLSTDATATATDFVLPRGLTRLSDNDLLVADPLAQQLVRLTSEGSFVEVYGQRGVDASELNFPNDVDSTSDDLLLITDRENNRVQVARIVTE